MAEFFFPFFQRLKKESEREPALVSAELSAEEIQSILSHYDFSKPEFAERVIADVDRLFRKGNVKTAHRRYMGLFNPSVHPIAVAGEALAGYYNPQLASFATSPAAQALESRFLDFLRMEIGLAADWSGHFTSSGSEANLTAVLVALETRFPGFAREGFRSFDREPMLYCSELGHGSIEKAARIAGLGSKSVCRIGVDCGGRIDADELERTILADKARHKAPFLIVGTVGTTAMGSIDPMPALTVIARRYGLFLHADAAWGGAAMLCPSMRRELFAGIEEVDSIAMDAHKWFSAPLSAGMFFTRRAGMLTSLFSVDANYMPYSVQIDPYRNTILWSRRCLGLPLFMVFAELGKEGVFKLIEKQTAMGGLLRHELIRSGYRILNDSPLPLVCFTHTRIKRESILRLASAIAARGRVWISGTELPHHGPALRACITSYKTGPSDIAVLIKELERVRREMIDAD